MPLKACAGKDGTAPFYTCSPYGGAKQYANVSMWRNCIKEETWDYIDNSFLVGLVAPGQVVQHKEPKAFHLIVNMVDGQAAVSFSLVKRPPTISPF